MKKELLLKFNTGMVSVSYGRVSILARSGMSGQ